MRSFKRRPSAEEVEQIAQVANEEHLAIVPQQVLAPAQGDHETERAYSVGQIIFVPIRELKANQFNARRVVSPAGLDDLADTLKERGQDTAALGYFDETNDICLIDGHRRMQASLIAGIDTLRVEIRPRPETDQELYLASRQANKDREDQTPLDDALAWKMLLDRKTFESQAELGRRLKIEPTMISRTLGLAELPKMLIGMLTERPTLMSLRMLDALKRYYDVAGEEATEALILEISSQDLSSRDVDARRISIQKAPVSRARSAISNIKYDKGNCIVKRFTGQGKLLIEVKNVSTEEDIDKLTEEVNKLFAKMLSKE